MLPETCPEKPQVNAKSLAGLLGIGRGQRGRWKGLGMDYLWIGRKESGDSKVRDKCSEGTRVRAGGGGHTELGPTCRAESAERSPQKGGLQG